MQELLVGLDRNGAHLHTTSYWYYRACRAAVAGAGGHLSGPFRELPPAQQQQAITAMLQLPEEIGLPRPRDVVPIMASVAGRHPMLNVLNLEAVATAHWLRATVWLSPEGTLGMLPSVLGAEDLNWETITPN
ncbi:MAG: hypothetical protein ACRDYB_11740 [Acidimicrobiales bacterium]